jgi:hypothetical protein
VKTITFFLIMVFSINIYADDNAKIKVKEVKAYLETIDTRTTCMDEYIKRREQLIVKLALSPVFIAGSTAVSVAAGSTTGLLAAVATGVDGWTGLGYFIIGGALGGAGGAVASTVDSTSAAFKLHNINLIIKTLGEQHMNIEGKKSNELYEKYVKRSQNNISEEEFLARLMAADANGTLCDGSMVKQPRIKIGSKTKFKVAKLKDIVREL